MQCQSVGTATPNAIYTQQGAKPARQQDIHTKFSQLLLAQLPRTQFTHSKPPNPHARNTITQNLSISYWRSYPERNLHRASHQTRMPARHPHKIFASPIGTPTPNASQKKRMPVCVTSTCVMSICATSSCVMSVCECVVSICAMSSCVMSSCVMSICVMSSCATSICVMSICVMSSCVMSTCVMSICAMSICVMSTCVMSICVMSSCVTSIFVMSICAMSSCATSVCVCVCVMSICVVSVCVMSICVMSICVMSICVHSYPERNLHTARRHTRMPARHPRKIFAVPIGTATPNAIYTQQAAKPACQEHITAKF